MKIIDLTTAYPNCINDKDAIAKYEQLCRPLFEHYNRYWTVSDYPYCLLEPKIIQEQVGFVRAALVESLKGFDRAGLDTSKLKAILFVGKGTSNGHAFFDGENWIVWLPVETYTSKALAEVFVPHEVAHALHYRADQGFYFGSQSEKDDLLRQLIAEGMATYVPMKVCGLDEITAFWADFLSQEEASVWMKECSRRLPELSQQLLYGTENGENMSHYFRADDSSDITKFRAGYYVGVRIVDTIARTKNLAIRELLTIPADQFKKMALQQLGHMATV